MRHSSDEPLTADSAYLIATAKYLPFERRNTFFSDYSQRAPWYSISRIKPKCGVDNLRGTYSADTAVVCIKSHLSVGPSRLYSELALVFDRDVKV